MCDPTCMTITCVVANAKLNILLGTMRHTSNIACATHRKLWTQTRILASTYCKQQLYSKFCQNSAQAASWTLIIAVSNRWYNTSYMRLRSVVKTPTKLRIWHSKFCPNYDSTSSMPFEVLSKLRTNLDLYMNNSSIRSVCTTLPKFRLNLTIVLSEVVAKLCLNSA